MPWLRVSADFTFEIFNVDIISSTVMAVSVFLVYSFFTFSKLKLFVICNNRCCDLAYYFPFTSMSAVTSSIIRILAHFSHISSNKNLRFLKSMKFCNL